MTEHDSDVPQMGTLALQDVDASPAQLNQSLAFVQQAIGLTADFPQELADLLKLAKVPAWGREKSPLFGVRHLAFDGVRLILGVFPNGDNGAHLAITLLSDQAGMLDRQLHVGGSGLLEEEQKDALVGFYVRHKDARITARKLAKRVGDS